VAYLQKPFTADKVRNVLAGLQCSGPAAFKGGSDIGGTVERLMGEGNFTEALRLLKKELSERPLEAGIYLQLSQVSEKLGLPGDAEKYRRLYSSIE
jgi:two-component system OmpR family response regulator